MSLLLHLLKAILRILASIVAVNDNSLQTFALIALHDLDKHILTALNIRAMITTERNECGLGILQIVGSETPAVYVD